MTTKPPPILALPRTITKQPPPDLPPEDPDVERARRACAHSINSSREMIAKSKTISQMIEKISDGIPVKPLDDEDSLVIQLEEHAAATNAR